MFGQTNRVLITIDWPSEANNNIVEVYDPANNLLVTITSNGETQFNATYDLGCLTKDPSSPATFHYVKLFDTTNTVPTPGDGWASGSSIVVNVAGTDVLTDSGSDANSTGGAITNYPNSGDSGIIFSINQTPDCTLDDTDGDGVIDFVDQDDDNDGILDTEEGLALNQFNCEVPSLIFQGGFYDTTESTAAAGNVGAVYRFPNASEGIDVLLQIVELDNTTITNIDDDTVDTPEFLQSRLQFSGNGTPGVTYEFSLVNSGGTLSDLAAITRIGGTTWDCDGLPEYQESVRYYYPSAYGLDNPTSLTQDIYDEATYPGEAGAGITAGTVTYGGFSTNTILRSYFQFLANKFKIRMQLKKTTSTTRNRLYAMSFTQCDIFEYKAPTLTILTGQDTDGDGLDNQFDLDADNDGIPDNVEAQPTLSYVGPNYSGTPFEDIDPITGVDTAYASGITVVDTDGDNIPDFIDSDSDNDGTPDIEENGMANSIVSFTDSDNDGLDDLFEGGTDPTTELDPNDVNDEIDNPSSSILPDTDNDLFTGGDLDYRDASDFGSATIDFDGEDDYLSTPSFMAGWQNATLMAWVRLATDYSSQGTIAGETMFNLRISSSGQVNSYLITDVDGTSYQDGTSWSLNTNQWYHIAQSYNGADGLFALYVNGEKISEISVPVSTLSTTAVFAEPDFAIGRSERFENDYFKGSIDEVRVFNLALTEDQIQRMVYQEIENNANNVRGTQVPKDIVDIGTGVKIPWTNLQAYWPMTNISNSKTADASSYNRAATLYNITTIQPQTAPMPYETQANGLWTSEATWLHGDVWDIEDVPNNKDWSIVHIHDNVTTSSSHTQLGMFIDDTKTLTVSGDNEINNSWYLEINGTIDLLGDSQLVQTENSDLVTDADGKVLRRQEGNLNYYWYNYWSSPVGATAATTNSNTNFSINMLKDSSGTPVTFTSSYHQTGSISTSWLYKFQNGQTYYDWEALTPTSAIQPGVGYTQKGTNNASGDFQYIFEGKPNNGTILLPADDVDGDSANEHLNEPGNYNYTSTLIGNPYPSTIDAREFIEDNPSVISGTVYVWEQWAGTSHILNEYQGGYGTINFAATAPAYQWNDPSSGADPLAKTPSFFIPVGQGFFVEVVADSGDIEFNNSQRVFKTEAEVDGPIFFRTAGTQDDQQPENPFGTIGLIKLQLNVSNGNMRQFVLGFSDTTTDGFNYGYDARTIDPQQDDLNSYLNGEKMIIQSYSPITNDKVIDLIFNSSGTYNYSLEIIEMQGISEDQEIYLRDNFTNTYFDLRSGAYNFSSEVNAEDTERFDIVFQSGETLSDDEILFSNTTIFVNNTEDVLYVKGLETNAMQLNITNMLGQNIKSFGNLDNQTLENGLDISSLSSGVYIVSIINESNQTFDKKVVID